MAPIPYQQSHLRPDHAASTDVSLEIRRKGVTHLLRLFVFTILHSKINMTDDGFK